MASTKPKIAYFPFPGRSLAAQLAFRIGGIEYDYEPIQFPDWPARKATTPTGKLPLLYIGDAVYPQSKAILRYAGKLSGLYPEDPLVALAVDSIMDQASEVDGAIAGTMREDQAEKEAARQAIFAEGGAAYNLIMSLENLIGDNGFAVGDSLTIADLHIFAMFDYVNGGLLDGITPGSLTGIFAKCDKIVETVKANEVVAAFYAEQAAAKAAAEAAAAE